MAYSIQFKDSTCDICDQTAADIVMDEYGQLCGFYCPRCAINEVAKLLEQEMCNKGGAKTKDILVMAGMCIARGPFKIDSVDGQDHVG